MNKDILIPANIDSSEILVHYIFTKHFDKKIISSNISDLVNREVLMPNKGSVSLQRGKYCNENKCKEFALKIPDRIYSGFLVFTMRNFDEVKTNYKNNSRKDFEAIIEHTPLDEDFNYLPKHTSVYIKTKGNPAHSDLRYVNPAQINEESPNTAIRSFTRKLLQVCDLLIDKNFKGENYEGILFKSCI